MNMQLFSERRLPTTGQKVVGILSVLLILPLIGVISATGSALNNFNRPWKDPPILPFTPALIEIGQVVGDFWYIAVALTIGIYAFWIIKNARRLLWFNAIAAVFYPLVFWCSFSIAMEQQEATVSWLHQQRAAGVDVNDLLIKPY